MGRNTKLITAQQLIKEKNYSAARAVLETVNNDPTAQRWLKKLDDIPPQESKVIRPLDTNIVPPPPPQPKTSNVAFSIVCSKCEAQTRQPIYPELIEHNFRCPHCDTAFTTNLFQIRASSSRGYDSYRRTYNVRVFGADGTEKHLTFSTQKNLRMELRSKDIAGFTYLDTPMKDHVKQENRLQLEADGSVDRQRKSSSPTRPSRGELIPGERKPHAEAEATLLHHNRLPSA
jgi:hypothetical protein